MTWTQRLTRRTRVGLAIAVAAVLVAAGLFFSGAFEDESVDDPILVPKGTVHIATAFDQPGFDLYRDHRHRGFDMDLAYYLGAALDFTPKFQDTTHAARATEITQTDDRKRSADMVIATYSITPKRMKQVDFVGPYLTTQQGFLVRENYNGIKKEKDLSGKTVCAVEGTTPTEVGMPSDTTMQTEPDYSTCVRKLRDKAIDAVFSDEVILFGYAQQYQKTKAPLKVVPNVTMGLINRYGIGIPKGHRDECRRIVKAVHKYLVDKWASDLKTQLPALVDNHSDDWQNRFKPDPEELNTYSCRDRL